LLEPSWRSGWWLVEIPRLRSQRDSTVGKDGTAMRPAYLARETAAQDEVAHADVGICGGPME
jgi:hypothetical protein